MRDATSPPDEGRAPSEESNAFQGRNTCPGPVAEQKGEILWPHATLPAVDTPGGSALKSSSKQALPPLRASRGSRGAYPRDCVCHHPFRFRCVSTPRCDNPNRAFLFSYIDYAFTPHRSSYVYPTGLKFVSPETRNKVERLARETRIKRALSSTGSANTERKAAPGTGRLSKKQYEERDRGAPRGSPHGQGDPYTALRRAPPMGPSLHECFLEPCVEDAVTCDGALEITITGLTLMKHFSNKNVFYVVVSAPPFKVVTAPAIYYPFDKGRVAKARRTRLSKMYGRQKGVVDFDMPQCFRMLVLAGTTVRLEVWKERLGIVDEGPYAVCTLQIPKLDGKGETLHTLSGEDSRWEVDSARIGKDVSHDGPNGAVGPTSHRLLEPYTDGHTRGTIQVDLELTPRPGTDRQAVEASAVAPNSFPNERVGGARRLDESRGDLGVGFASAVGRSISPPLPPSAAAFKKITTAEMLRLVCADSSGVFQLDTALGFAHSRCTVLAVVGCHVAEALLQGTIEAVKTERLQLMGWLTETVWEVVPGRTILDGEEWAGGYARHLQRVVYKNPGMNVHDLLALLTMDIVDTALPGWTLDLDSHADQVRGGSSVCEEEWEAVSQGTRVGRSKSRKGSKSEDENIARNSEERGAGAGPGDDSRSVASTMLTRTAELLRGLGRFALDGISLAADVTTGSDPFATNRDVLAASADVARRKTRRKIDRDRRDRLKGGRPERTLGLKLFSRFLTGLAEADSATGNKQAVVGRGDEEEYDETSDDEGAVDGADETYNSAWEDDLCGTRRLGVEADPLLKIDIMNRLRRISLDNATRGRVFESEWRSPTRIQRDAMRGLRSKRWLPPPPPVREPPPPNNKHRLHRQVFIIAVIASLDTPVPLFDADELRRPSLSCGSLMDYATEVRNQSCGGVHSSPSLRPLFVRHSNTLQCKLVLPHSVRGFVSF